MAQTFALIRPLLIPLGTDSAPAGFTYFPPVGYGLGYSGFKPVEEKKRLNIAVVVRRLPDGEAVYTVKEFEVTASGFQTDVVLNQSEIDTATNLKADLEMFISQNEGELALAKDEVTRVLGELAIADDTKTIDKLKDELADKKKIQDDLTAQLLADRTELNALVIPNPEFARAWKYEEVVEWFDNKGRLLPDFVAAALEIKLFGRRVGDFVESQPFVL